MHSGNIRSVRDLALVVVCLILVLAATLWLDPIRRGVAWVYRHDTWKLDEIFALCITLVLGLAWYAWRRWRELREQERRRQRAEHESLVFSRLLQDTLAELQVMEGQLRICEVCKRVRDGSGYWIALETYVESYSRARFFQGLCPDCARKTYGTDGGARSAPAA